MKNQRANDAHMETTLIFAKNIVALLCILLLFNRKIRLRKQIWREHFRNFRITFRVRMQPVTEQFGVGVFARFGAERAVCIHKRYVWRLIREPLERQIQQRNFPLLTAVKCARRGQSAENHKLAVRVIRLHRLNHGGVILHDFFLCITVSDVIDATDEHNLPIIARRQLPNTRAALQRRLPADAIIRAVAAAKNRVPITVKQLRVLADAVANEGNAGIRAIPAAARTYPPHRPFPQNTPAYAASRAVCPTNTR